MVLTPGRRLVLPIFASIAALLLAVTGCQASQGGAAGSQKNVKTQTIKLGLIQVSAASWPNIVANKEGMWKEAGIAIQTTQIGSSEGIQSVDNGALNVILVPCNTEISLIEHGGLHNKAILMASADHPGQLFGGKNVNAFKDLKGGKIGTLSINSGSTIILRRLLANHGLKEGDYDLVAANTASALYAGVQAGSLQGAWASPPVSVIAKQAGYTILGNFLDAVPRYQYGCLAANTDWTAANPKLAEAFVATWLKGTAWLKDPANRKKAEADLAGATDVKPDVASATYDLMVAKHPNIFPKDGRVDHDAMKVVVDLMVEGGELKAAPKGDVSRYYDMSFVNAAEGTK